MARSKSIIITLWFSSFHSMMAQRRAGYDQPGNGAAAFDAPHCATGTTS